MNIAVISKRYVELVARTYLAYMGNKICIDSNNANFPKYKKDLSAIK